MDNVFPWVVAVEVSSAYFTSDTEFKILTNRPLLIAADRLARS